MKNKQQTILKQITKPFILFMVILVIANAVALAIFTSGYYLSDQYKEASNLARCCVAEYESYKSLDWLIDYWHENSAGMDLVYDDEALLEKKEAQLREANPEIGELAAVSAETAAALDETSQKLFAELCYSRLSGEFDRMKQAHRPLYLYSFMVFGDEMFIYVTGKLEDEKRISEGGELFELGFTSEYQTGAYPVADRILSTGKPVNDMELSRAKGADRSVVHTFEPVYANGQLKAIVGVSIRSREMLKQILVMMRTMLLITIAFFTVMILIVVHHIRKIVVIPINKEKEILEDYERDKDSASASKLLATINTHNEIERMANSFSSMVTELDRYMEEIKSVTAEKERIGAELNVATKIQADMLPRKFPAFPDRNEFDLYATMTPAKEVGGDFYDFFLVDDDHIMLVMADVSGKGVPAALFMVIAKTLIKNHAMLGGTPSTVLARTNDQLCEHNEAELFVTVWIALIEISTGKGIAANAGHEHPVIKHAGGDWELIEYRHSPPVATMEGVKFKEHEFEIHPGDSLYVYTDGVAEATDSNNELFGTERMLDVLNANKDASPKELLEAVKAGIDDFVGDAPQFDDITMMCFDYTGKQ